MLGLDRPVSRDGAGASTGAPSLPQHFFVEFEEGFFAPYVRVPKPVQDRDSGLLRLAKLPELYERGKVSLHLHYFDCGAVTRRICAVVRALRLSNKAGKIPVNGSVPNRRHNPADTKN